MSEVLGWRIDERSGESWAVTAEWQAVDAGSRGFKVTPLVAAPPTVADAALQDNGVLLDALHAAAIVLDGRGLPLHAARVRVHIDNLEAVAPPEDGRPTYVQLVEGIREYLAADEAVDREAERTPDNPAGWSSAPVVRRSLAIDTLRALLSRLPKEKP